MKHYLYRHYSETGDLLYIGISLNHVQRLTQHQKTASWFEQIQRIEIEKFDSRPEVELAEQAAIKAERPLYNISHNQLVNKPTRKKPVFNKKSEEQIKIDKWAKREVKLMFM